MNGSVIEKLFCTQKSIRAELETEFMYYVEINWD